MHRRRPDFPLPLPRRPWVWLVLACVVHVLLLLFLKPWFLLGASIGPVAGSDNVVVTLASDEAEDQTIDDSRYRPSDDVPEGQVVNPSGTSDPRRPDQARYVSERNNRTDRETRSRFRLRGFKNMAPSASGPGGTGLEPVPGGMANMSPGGSVANEGLPLSQDGTLSHNRGAPEAQLNINLRPSSAALNAVIAGTGLDNLEGAEEGDRTFLNTQEWRHATFFNRVKWQVEQYWRPDLEYRKHDPYGNIYGYKDRETVIRVVLQADGRLYREYVMSPSGASFLDDEALEAIRQAAPFPNPPEALKDPKTGIIAFTFGFTVRIDGSPVFRMRRYEGR